MTPASESPSPAGRAKTIFLDGCRLMGSGDNTQAESLFQQAIGHDPDLAEAHANLAYLLSLRGQLAEAEDCYQRALALAPRTVEVWLNLGALLMAQKRYAEAEPICLQALALREDNPAAHSNLGALYLCWHREAVSEFHLRRAIALDGRYDKPRVNLANLLLRQGRFDEGWAMLEARDWYAGLAKLLPCQRWQGEALEGKSVLIGLEAGLGDMIQFCRYAALLKARGAQRVGLLSHPLLTRLFCTLEAVDEVIGVDTESPNLSWDFWSPPLSMPFYCQTGLGSIPARLPYLQAQPEAVARWRARLARECLPDQIRVGLVWKGNRNFENDADRSLPSLRTLAPLWAVPGVASRVQFVSLQKGAGEDEARQAALEGRLIDLGPELMDFADTAAVLAGLDLVISVDTAAAHLAGALAKSCWLLLPDHKTDWRWLSDRQDSPWYPEVMRLFRQDRGGGEAGTEGGNWTPVIARLGEALAQWLEQGVA